MVVTQSKRRQACVAISRIREHIKKHLILQAILVGALSISLVALYVIGKNGVIAPLNTMPGWNSSIASGSVVARYPSDVLEQILPFRYYQQESLRETGKIPLWNNASFSGESFVANPINTPLSPLIPLLLILDIYTFQNILILSGLFLMASCAYLLLRRLGVSSLVSIAASISYAYAPFSIFWSLYGIIAIPMALLPLALFSYLQWRDQRSALNPYTIALSFALSVGFYFGHLQVALTPMLAVGLLAVFDTVGRRLHLRQIIALFSTFVISLALAAAQLAPMLAQTGISHRTGTATPSPISLQQIAQDIAHLPNYLIPTISADELGATMRKTMATNPIFGMAFFASIILAVYYILRKKLNATWGFFVLLFVVGALWQWSSVPQILLAKLSPTAASLATDYYIPLALLSIIVLASLCLDTVADAVSKVKKRYLHVRVPIYYALAALGAIALLGSLQLTLHTQRLLPEWYYFVYYGMAIMATIYIIFINQLNNSRLLSSLILILVIIYAWAQFISTQPIVTREIIKHKSPSLEYIKHIDPSHPVILDYIGPQSSIMSDVRLMSGYDSLYEKTIKDRIDAINSPLKTPITYRDNSLMIVNTDKTTLFQNLGVRYVINGVVPGYSNTSEGVLKSDLPADTVYFAESVLQSNQAQQLDYLKSGDVSYRSVPIAGDHTIADSSSNLTYRTTANTISITTSSTTGGLVFIAYTYSKDWHAYLENNEPISISPAYFNFMAIDAPKGNQRIVLRYEPKSLVIGAWITGSGGLVIVVLLIKIYHQYRRLRQN